MEGAGGLHGGGHGAAGAVADPQNYASHPCTPTIARIPFLPEPAAAQAGEVTALIFSGERKGDFGVGLVQGHLPGGRDLPSPP